MEDPALRALEGARGSVRVQKVPPQVPGLTTSLPEATELPAAAPHLPI